MDATGPCIRLEHLKIIHENDRAIYSILVSNFWRNPWECLQIMCLWLWLDRVGFCSLMGKIYSLSLYKMNELADEASICLKCVNGARLPFSGEDCEISLTQSLTAQEISLKFFHDIRLIALSEIGRLATEVYTPVLADIMTKAVNEDDAESLSHNLMMMSGNALRSLSMNQMMVSSLNEPLTLSSSQFRIGGAVTQGRAQVNDIAGEDRRMFATFSRGYPVSESEVRQFLTRIYGNCIDSIYMQQVMPNEQALYAVVVLHHPSFVGVILNGQTMAKFAFNGKQMWMRKFVPKNGRSYSYRLPATGYHRQHVR